MAHARRLSKQGEFVSTFVAGLRYTGMDKGTAGDVERRVAKQLDAAGVRLMNSSRIWGPPSGRMLALLIMNAKYGRARVRR